MTLPLTLATGVNAASVLALPAFSSSFHFLIWLRVAALSFGLTISSTEKLMSARAAPNRAMHSPGGMNHHHAPRISAMPFCA